MSPGAPMSFRNRLILFFVVIVIVPMIAVALVLFRLVADSEAGQIDARLEQAQRAAEGVYASERRQARAAGRRIGSDRELAGTLASRDRARIRERLMLLGADVGAARVRVELVGLGSFDLGGRGRRTAVAPAASRLVDARGGAVGRLQVSVQTASEYARQVDQATQLPAVIALGERVVAVSERLGAPPPRRLPARGPVTIGGDDYRVTSFTAPGFDEARIRVRLLANQAVPRSGFAAAPIVIGAAVLGFLLLALAFALAVSRSFQHQIERLLDAARRLGTGDFRSRVPTEGNDEFAQLGTEFNAMARQLELRLEELQTERARLQGAIRRVGDSFAKGLDRDALLDIVVETAVDGVGGDCGRATVQEDAHGSPVEVARVGDLAARRSATEAAEAEALATSAIAEVTDASGTALAQPLRSSDGARVLGVISVARAARPFTEPDMALFNYLANQAAVSIENVDLHQAVQRQAVTDELTGLFNHRRFQEVMALEVERTRRFGSEMGLILFDIDDFKAINDTYGHVQGDMVLREVAQVLRESARAIDEPARYGGEEMAVALPQTDLEGAFRFAERVRRRIEALELPILDGSGTIRVTASFGVASTGDGGLGRDADKEALVAAADAAMYRAKRAGKNRTVKAG